MEAGLLNAATITTTCTATGSESLHTGATSQTAIRIAYVSQSSATVVHIAHNLETSNVDCAVDYYCGGTLSANPDVAGLSVTISFLISAYAALIFIWAAYWLGYLPAALITSTDKVCFKAHSRRCYGTRKTTLEEFITAISDLQLITGLAILFAGWIHVSSLDVYHWYSVVYLAWTSSTVHLLLLSLIRVRLHQNRFLKYLRLAGMALLLGLLVTALILTRSLAFREALLGLENENGLTAQATMASCFWDLSNTIKPDGYDSGIAPDVFFSLTILLLSYSWKTIELFEGPHEFFRRWTRIKPKLLLERAARRYIPVARPWSGRRGLQQIRYKLIAFVYVNFVMITQCLNAFITTIILLLFTLVWGTLRLVLVRFEIPHWVIEAEMSMSFGQLLALLLLLHPLSSIIRHFASKKRHRRHDVTNQGPSSSQSLISKLAEPSSQASLTDIELTANDTTPDPPMVRPEATLSQALLKKAVSTGDSCAASTALDPMEYHLLFSKAFKCMIWLFYFTILSCMAVLLYFGGKGNGLISAWYYMVVGSIFFIGPMFMVLFLSSRKLRA